MVVAMDRGESLAVAGVEGVGSSGFLATAVAVAVAVAAGVSAAAPDVARKSASDILR